MKIANVVTIANVVRMIKNATVEKNVLAQITVSVQKKKNVAILVIASIINRIGNGYTSKTKPFRKLTPS